MTARMHARHATPRRALAKAWPPCFLFIVAGLAVPSTACVAVDGGAVEATWWLFDDQGRAINDCGCSDPPIASVAFQLVGTGREGSVEGATPCAGQSSCVFACHRKTGTTHFDVPPGEYAFTLVALDANGSSLSAPECNAAGAVEGSDQPPPAARCVEAPARILRTVIRGQATDVNALPLITTCSDACSGSSSSGVCAHP